MLILSQVDCIIYIPKPYPSQFTFQEVGVGRFWSSCSSEESFDFCYYIFIYFNSEGRAEQLGTGGQYFSFLFCHILLQ